MRSRSWGIAFVVAWVAESCGGQVATTPEAGTKKSDGGHSTGASGGSGGLFGGAGGLLGGSGGTPANGGSSGFGGSGGYPLDTTRLGRACYVQTECGEAYTCVTADSGNFDGESPAKGYCTIPCAAEADCAFFPQAHCHLLADGKGYCFEGCKFGPVNLTTFDPKKCHGRQEVACSPVEDAAGNFSYAECTPQCNADTDCGSGLFCNPRTGLCTTMQPSGKDIGEPCIVASETGVEVCKGVCADFYAITGPGTSSCTQGCVIGSYPNCGWAGIGSGPAPATCLLAPDAVQNNGGPGLGDFGLCGPLCDCTLDCKLTWLGCRAWSGPNAAELEDFFGRKGYCTDQLGDAGADILTSCDAG